MLAYRWPGNVRELQNVVERAVILSENGRSVTAVALGLPLPDGTVPEPEPAELEPAMVAEAPVAAGEGEGAAAASVAVTSPTGTVLSIAELEKQAIRAALLQTEGNRTQAASLLGISIRTLRNKLQEYREGGDPVECSAGDE
jgi:DNA-binding NtrC family response regulator